MMNTTTIRPLPVHPDQEQYDQEAADLMQAVHAGIQEARQRIRLYNQLVHRSSDPMIMVTDNKFDLTHAQRVVARLYGFTSWQQFTSFIAAVNDPTSPVAQFEAAVEAIIHGDIATLQSLLQQDPHLVHLRSMRIHQATLLLYTSANGIEGYRQKSPAMIAAIARMLLQAGADANAELMDGGRGTTLGLVATSIHPDRAGVQIALMDILFEYGAAIDGAPDGWQPLMAALANGRPEAVEWLANHGAQMTIVAAAGLGRLDKVKSFFRQDGSFNASLPYATMWGVPAAPEKQLIKALMYASIYGHTPVVAFLIAKGVDPGVQDDDGYTGLHWAAHGGHVDIVDLLLAHKVPLELKNCHGGTVLGQALWSAGNHADGWSGNKPGLDYLPIIERLLAAGAKLGAGWYTGIEHIDQILQQHAAALRPLITSPVSRHLMVSDIARSVAFYCDVLGFEPAPVTIQSGVPSLAEVVYGPARIQFYTEAGTVDSSGPLSAPGSAMVFFEVEDVGSMHAAIAARGGQVTRPEKVNWIKIELFEVRDPDGHALWFGRSYHKFYDNLHTEAGEGQLRKIMPSMPLSNVPAGVAYYRDVLGFSVNYQQHDLGVMDRDSVRILLTARTAQTTGIGSCCVYIRDADALYDELLAKGANIPAPPVSRPWGLREFHVLDPEGNMMSFAQTFE